MASMLFRTGSGPINSPLLPGSSRISVPLRHGSISASEKTDLSPLVHLEVNNSRRTIHRAISEPQAILRLRSISSGSQTLPDALLEVEEEEISPDEDVAGVSGTGTISSLKFAERCFDRMSCFPATEVAAEEPQFPGGRGRDGFGYGSGSGRFSGGNGDGYGNGNDYNERSKIGAHYQKMLKLNPNDPLLLRNYGKFLHEVEGDTVKAEEYYGRAILANPGDGELLSLYGKLIWDTDRDGERVKSYFDQAVSASPDDCMVMGSYAQFMWEADEDDEESGSMVSISASKSLVAAF